MVANLMASLLASRVVIFSWVGACLVKPLLFEDHPSTRACQTGPRKQFQEKQTNEPLSMIHTWTVILLVQQLSGGEKCALSICVNQANFGKSGRKCKSVKCQAT